ncbi:periplasmic sensor signal transduction histidine kinase [Salinisphaera sp. C84B14]|jgi:signal transduction histidine kinase|uniref:sensor histidine kinase n=1 Tax=Salinisphaera sp. C84B14 TaxID=1304155 RepID=UPI0033414364
MTSFSLRPGLRPRILLATLVPVLVVLGGMVYAVSSFLEVLEHDMTHGQLARELDRVDALYRRDPQLLDLLGPNLETYVVPKGDTDSLPDSVKPIRNGESHEVWLPGADYEYQATRRDIGDHSLYVLLDLTPEERLEKELIGVAWIAGLGAMFLAVLVALWLSHVVMRPVRRLAHRVSAIVPGEQRPDLTPATGDRQLNIIVEAFDGVLDRFDAFVAREQAFTEDASHELRTPLATVISSLDLIVEDRDLSAKSQRRLARARAAATRMHELIEALLLFAREQGSEVFDTPVSPVVREAIAMQGHLFSAQTAAAIAFEAETEVHVNAPSSMVLSVVNNLLRNAIEHGDGARIDVRLDATGLSIRDHGAGIAPAALSRLFDRRFKGQHSRGQGLGLYLVKRVSERFGWRVEVDSNVGAGTEFVLYFAA